jgi:hypothetical protein
MDGRRQNIPIHYRTKFARIDVACAPMAVEVRTSAHDFTQRGHRDLTLQVGKTWDAKRVLRSGKRPRRAAITRARAIRSDPNHANS